MSALERRMRAKDIDERCWRLAVGGWERQMRQSGTDGGTIRGEELAAVFGPGVLLGFHAGGLAHLEEYVAMGQGPVELLLDGGGTTGCDK